MFRDVNQRRKSTKKTTPKAQPKPGAFIPDGPLPQPSPGAQMDVLKKRLLDVEAMNQDLLNRIRSLEEANATLARQGKLDRARHEGFEEAVRLMGSAMSPGLPFPYPPRAPWR